jgi:hypothetical protein
MAELTDIATVCSPRDTFAGKSYSEWIIDWNRWLVSADISSDIQGTVCFTHGNLNYQYDSAGSARIMNPIQETYNRINENGILVSKSTGILFPIITSTRMAGFRDYGGEVLWTELDLKNASKNDIAQGGLYYLNVSEKKAGYTLNHLDQYNFQTPLYDLEVSERNPFLEKFEVPIEPGTYKAVTSGIFVIFQFKTAGTYFVAFGGDGVGTYKTRAVYSFTILESKDEGDAPRSTVTTEDGKKFVKEFKDISKEMKVFDTIDERFYKKKP